jgi:hypothetical protein
VGTCSAAFSSILAFVLFFACHKNTSQVRGSMTLCKILVTVSNLDHSFTRTFPELQYKYQLLQLNTKHIMLHFICRSLSTVWTTFKPTFKYRFELNKEEQYYLLRDAMTRFIVRL